LNVGVYHQLAGDAGPYALGVLNASEKAAFEAHLATCVECAAEVRRFSPVLEALARTSPDAAPRSAVRELLLTRLRNQRGFQIGWLAVAATALLAIAFGAYAVQLRWRVIGLRAQLDHTTMRADVGERRIADLQKSAADAETTAAVLAAPDLARVDLAGQQTAPGASARIFYSRTRGLVFTAANLPAPPAGRIYQLWVLTGEQAPASAGLLRPDRDGRVTALFPPPTDLPKPIAMAVTLEPEGGVLSPTGDKYLVGLAH
jgi:anti-sigma-K factor RskA